MAQNLKNNAGVSIVEVLVALVLVSLALVAIATVFPRMATHGKSIHEADQAKALASEIMEGLQLFSTYDSHDGCETATISCHSMCAGNTLNSAFNDSLYNYDPGYADFRDNLDDLMLITKGRIINGTQYTIINKNEIPGSGLEWKCQSGDLHTVTVNVYWKKNNKPHSINVTGVVSTR